jgi:serine/threonine protein kinase
MPQTSRRDPTEPSEPSGARRVEAMSGETMSGDVSQANSDPQANADEMDLVVRYGRLDDGDLPVGARADQLADLLVEIGVGAGVECRRTASVVGSLPAVALQADGVGYLLTVAWSADPVTGDEVAHFQRAAAARPGLRFVLLSMAGFTAEAVASPTGDMSVVVMMMDRLHAEAMLCALVELPWLLGRVGQRALFDQVVYTNLADLLVDTTLPAPPAFVTPDRRPAPWDLTVDGADNIRIQHLFSGEEGWSEPLGFAPVDETRLWITTGEGIVEVDAKRGSTRWLLPLPGCRGNPLPRADGGVLTVCGPAVVGWKDGVLTPVAGSLRDARTLLTGPGGDPWVLSGYGPEMGSGAGTLAMTRLGPRLGTQQRRSVAFDANVHTAGWLADLRFFLAAGGNSAVIDLARSSRARPEDWIVTPPHRPGHLVVADPHTILTASPGPGGTQATVCRTDLSNRTSVRLATVASNHVHGLIPSGRRREWLMLGDVRGNDIRRPWPVIIAIAETPPPPAAAHAPAHPAPASPVPDGGPSTPSVTPNASTEPDMPTPAGSATAPDTPENPLDRVRLAARGDRKDYRLDPTPLASGGQATVFGALHKPSGTRVAFKKLTTGGTDEVARMRREIEAAQQFGNHPNVMPVLDFSPAHDWFVMPLADHSAQTRVVDLVDPQRLRELVTAIGDALREPHERGWIHRDLKPDNILAHNGRWMVADWGLGRRPRGQTTDPQRTRTGGPFGTEGFAAPELTIDAHAVGPQADIYSIGQIIGWALTQQRPRANVALLPPPGPWRTIVKNATHPDPDRRPANVDELLALAAGELDQPPTLPITQGRALAAAAAAGDRDAPPALWRLAAHAHADYELYLEVLVDLDDEQTRAAVGADPAAAQEVVTAVHDLHTGGNVTLEYGDVDRLIVWLLIIAHQAEDIEEWDLLEDAAEAILYLDGWDRWTVQQHISAWLRTRSGHAASIVANALRRNPDVHPHFEHLATAPGTDHRVRRAAANQPST